MGSQLLRKISPQTICPGKLVRLDIPGAPEKVHLYDLYGIVTGTKQSKPGAEREWFGFKGDFEAVDADGVVYKSGVAFVHSPLNDMLYARLMQVKEQDENGSVQFAIRTEIVKPGKPKSIMGYEFRVSSIVEGQEVSPLQALRDQAKAALALLEAPKPAPVPEPTHAVESKKK